MSGDIGRDAGRDAGRVKSEIGGGGGEAVEKGWLNGECQSLSTVHLDPPSYLGHPFYCFSTSCFSLNSVRLCLRLYVYLCSVSACISACVSTRVSARVSACVSPA